MSAEHQLLESPSRDERTDAESRPPLDSTSSDGSGRVPHTDDRIRAGDTPSRTDARMASRIERTRLRARIDALERELAASECRRQAVVGQYELLLEDCRRDCDDSRSRTSLPSQLSAPIGRLIDALR